MKKILSSLVLSIFMTTYGLSYSSKSAHIDTLAPVHDFNEGAISEGNSLSYPCIPQNNISTYEFIQRLKLNTIDNLSGNDGGYADYTMLSTVLSSGSSYDLSLTPGYSAASYNVVWSIWIDYNQDNEFDEENELVISLRDKEIIQTTIDIPSNIKTEGSTIMRVALRYNIAPSPCGALSYGEVEDYRVIISDESDPCPELAFDSFESDYGNWNDGGEDCTRVNGFASSGSYSVRLRDDSGGKSALTSDIFDGTNYEVLNIQFSFYANSMELGEQFALQYSSDGGISYSTIQTWVSGIDFENNIRYHESIDLDNLHFTDDTNFRIICEASSNGDQVYLDDIAVNDCNSQTKVLSGIFETEIENDQSSADRKENNDNIENYFSVKNLFNQLDVYPNPASELLHIDHKIKVDDNRILPSSILVKNIHGQTVITHLIKSNQNRHTLNISQLQEGIYFVMLTADNKVIESKRVIVINR